MLPCTDIPTCKLYYAYVWLDFLKTYINKLGHFKIKLDIIIINSQYIAIYV